MHSREFALMTFLNFNKIYFKGVTNKFVKGIAEGYGNE